MEKKEFPEQDPHISDHCGTYTAGNNISSGISSNSVKNYSQQHSQNNSECGSDQTKAVTMETSPRTTTGSVKFLSETEVEKPRDILDESNDHYYRNVIIAFSIVVLLIASAVAWFGFGVNLFKWFIHLF